MPIGCTWRDACSWTDLLIGAREAERGSCWSHFTPQGSGPTASSTRSIKAAVPFASSTSTTGQTSTDPADHPLADVMPFSRTARCERCELRSVDRRCSVGSEDGEEGCVDCPLLLRGEMPGEVAESLWVHGTDLLDEDASGGAVDVDLGSKDAGLAEVDVGATSTTDRGRRTSNCTMTPKRRPRCSWPTAVGSRSAKMSPRRTKALHELGDRQHLCPVVLVGFECGDLGGERLFCRGGGRLPPRGRCGSLRTGTCRLPRVRSAPGALRRRVERRGSSHALDVLRICDTEQWA